MEVQSLWIEALFEVIEFVIEARELFL